MSQPDYFASNYAIMYPAVAVNANGDLGGTATSVGGVPASYRHPTVTAFIHDAVSLGYWQPQDVAKGAYTPPPPYSSNHWGDYAGAVAHEKYPKTWLGGGWVWEPDGTGFKPRPHIFWFFRGANDPGLHVEGCVFPPPQTRDTPKTIQDGGTVTSGISIPDASPYRFTASRIDVKLKVTNARSSDLLARLISPDGRTVELLRGVGGTNSSLDIGMLSERANPLPISLYPNSVVSNYRPQYALSGVQGQPAAGTWQLQVVDQVSNGIGGILQSWDVTLCSTQIQNPTTVGVFRPATATFYLKNQNNASPPDLTVAYGLANDLPVVGDWNDDGIDTLGVYRTATFYLRNSNTAGPPDIVVVYGAAGDLPVAGDWDGDGDETIGVFRNGLWLLRQANTAGSPDLSFTFGGSGQQPIVGDWNGDGIDSVGVFSNGTFQLRNTNTAGAADVVFSFGQVGDLAVVGDWDGEGVDTVGVYRSGTFYLRNTNTAGSADLTFNVGMVGDKPVAGDWDGRK